MDDVCPTVTSVRKTTEGTAQAAAALTRGQVGLRSHHPGQVGLEAMPHAEAMVDDRRDLRLLRRDGLLRLHRRHVGALMGYIMS